jgi:hypothetical protein
MGGKEQLMALGEYPDVTLASACELYREAHKKLASGVDPMAERRALSEIPQLSCGVMRQLIRRRFALQSSGCGCSGSAAHPPYPLDPNRRTGQALAGITHCASWVIFFCVWA